MKAAPEMNPVTRAAKGANELQAAQIPAFGQGKNPRQNEDGTRRNVKANAIQRDGNKDQLLLQRTRTQCVLPMRRIFRWPHPCRTI